MKASTLITATLMVAALPVTAVAADTDAGARLGEHPASTEAAREMGEHPAVLVYRNWDKRGYDYASKFYLHPARLALESVPPREMGDHPAVLVAKAWRERGYEEASKIGSHPALLPKAAAVPPAEFGLVLDHSAGTVPNAAARLEPQSGMAR